MVFTSGPEIFFNILYKIILVGAAIAAPLLLITMAQTKYGYPNPYTTNHEQLTCSTHSEWAANINRINKERMSIETKFNGYNVTFSGPTFFGDNGALKFKPDSITNKNSDLNGMFSVLDFEIDLLDVVIDSHSLTGVLSVGYQGKANVVTIECL